MVWVEQVFKERYVTKYGFGGFNIPNKTQKKSYPISISDWIIHLGNKSTTNINIQIFLASAILITIIGLISFGVTVEFDALTLLIIILIAYASFLIANKIITKMIKPYQQLSEKIIHGKLNEPIDILKEYNEIELHNKININPSEKSPNFSLWDESHGNY